MNKPGVRDLTCNYLDNPIGTALEPPFLNWKVASDQPGASQSAYQIQVATSPALASPAWDTGWVESNRSVHILYQGPTLQSSTKYFWRVRIRVGSNQTSDWSEPCFLETGLQISEIAVGTEHLVGQPRETVVPVVRQAAEHGVNYFDLVFSFPEYLDDLGVAFRGIRDRLLLTAHLGSAVKDGQYCKTRSVRTSERGISA